MMPLVHLYHKWEIYQKGGLGGGGGWYVVMIILVHFYLWDSDVCKQVGREMICVGG